VGKRGGKKEKRREAEEIETKGENEERKENRNRTWIKGKKRWKKCRRRERMKK
jgi:hypothetical protein